MVIALHFLALNKEICLKVLGWTGSITAVILLSSPLVTVKTVIKDKNSISMPFSTSLAMWINAFAWMIFGLLLENDPFIYVPNLLGFLAGTIQLMLIWYYPSKRLDDKTVNNVNEMT